MLRTYSVEKVVSKNGTVQQEGLPFPSGELVEVIVRARKEPAPMARPRALKGTVVKFELGIDWGGELRDNRANALIYSTAHRHWDASGGDLDLSTLARRGAI